MKTPFPSELAHCTKQDYEVVVCRYNEPLEWCRPIAHLVTVYNKGPIPIPDASDFASIYVLPNVGIGCHAFLTHIIRNYDRLADTTLFFQGAINDRPDQPLMPWPTYFQKNGRICGRFTYEHVAPTFRAPAYCKYHSGQNIREFCETVLGRPWPKRQFPWIKGDYMAVPREIIQRNTREYYEHLLESSDITRGTFTSHAYYFERLWMVIFQEAVE